jgi:hypothetical protein
MPLGSVVISGSRSRMMCLTPSRERLAESKAPVGPHPQITTSVVSKSDIVEENMYCEKSRKN